MHVDKVIENGTLVTSNETIDLNIAIGGGKIKAIGEADTLPAAEERIDANGALVMPGVVDPHTHIDASNPMLDAVETYKTGTRAAARGGVTTIIDFAWQGATESSENNSLQDCIHQKQRAGNDALVDYALHVTVTQEDRQIFEELPKVVEEGVTSFKIFTTYDFCLDNDFIDSLFEKISDIGAIAVVHTEDDEICKYRTDKLKNKTDSGVSEFPKTRPDYAEAIAAASTIRIAVENDCKYYGVHTTSKKAADVISDCQNKYGKEQVRAETCTHYCVFDDSVLEEKGKLALLAPPFRTKSDINSLFHHIHNGTLDVISTDHSAFKTEQKTSDKWWDTPLGTNSLQRSLPVFHEEAVINRGMSYPKLVRLMCKNPAQLFGMPQKGTLQPGTDADIVIFDPSEKNTIRHEDNYSNSNYSIYEGIEVSGSVKKTIVRGEVVMDDGEIIKDPGYGKYISRELPNWDTETDSGTV